MRESVTTKLCKRFDVLLLDGTDGQLVNTYNLSMRIVELENILSKYDMIDIFSFRFDSSTSISKNILSLFSFTSEQEICQSNRFYIQYGQDYDIYNLH